MRNDFRASGFGYGSCKSKAGVGNMKSMSNHQKNYI